MIGSELSEVAGSRLFDNPVGILSRTADGSHRIRNNVLYNTSEAAIRLDGAHGTGGASLVHNNTIHAASAAIHWTNGARSVDVRNNIFDVLDAPAFVADAGSTLAAGSISDYNLFHLRGSAIAARWNQLDLTSVPAIRNAVGWDSHSVEGNPRFVDADGTDGILGGDLPSARDDNFHLRTDSPAIDRGDPGMSTGDEPAPHGARINLGAHGGTLEAAGSPSEVLQILSPSDGARFRPGQEMEVSWHHASPGFEPVDALFRDAVLSLDPVAYYRLDETFGTIAADRSGAPRIHPGEYENGVPHGASGALGANPGAAFDGVDDLIRVERNPLFERQQITVSAWLRPESGIAELAGAVMNNQRFSEKIGHYISGYGLLHHGDGMIRFFINDNRENNRNGATVDASIPYDAWSLVTATFDGAELNLFVNGRLAASAPYQESIKFNANAGHDLLIGAGTGPGHAWKGGIDDVALFGRALTAMEVEALYAPIHRTPGTVDIELIGTGTGSPAIDRGTSVNVPSRDHDRQPRHDDPDTVNRTAGGFTDIGAAEFQGASLDVSPSIVLGSVPPEIHAGERVIGRRIDQIQLLLDEPLHVVDARNPTNYELRGPGPNRTFDDADDLIVPVTPDYHSGTLEIILRLPGHLAHGEYRLTLDGSKLRDTSGNALDGDGDGTAGGDYQRVFEIRAAVVGRHLFYNHSAFDGNDPSASNADDRAVAPDKQALMPGQAAAFIHYSSFDRGLNGIMVDVQNPGGTITADDFEFRLGNTDAVESWVTGPAPAVVSTRAGQGLNGSDRITLIWTDHAIEQQWLQVTVKATARTGLVENDVFYFGNAVGETGNDPSNAEVNSGDRTAIRDAPKGFLHSADLSDRFDLNRDRRVNAIDMGIARDHRAVGGDALRLVRPSVEPMFGTPNLRMTGSIAGLLPLSTMGTITTGSKSFGSSPRMGLADDDLLNPKPEFDRISEPKRTITGYALAL